MQWWCFAQQEAWSWTWRPLLGVWVLVAALLLLRRRAERNAAVLAPGSDEGRAARTRATFYLLGVALIWAGLDWPLGPLGAGYLASVHVTQFIMVGVAAPALLLLGLPEHAYRRLLEGRWLGPAIRNLTHPVMAFLIFNMVMTLTHWPEVVDRFMATPLGSFSLDAAWLVAGLLFWWPVIVPVPARPGFHPLLRLGYLALNAIIIRPPFAIMLFSEHPVYATYELAPPFLGQNPLHDQQFAGSIMKIGTAWIMGTAMLFVFRAWRRASEAAEG